MNILFAANRLTLGGAETHLVGLARVLQAKGHTLTVVSAGGPLVGELTEAGIPHYRLPLDKKTPLALLRSLVGLSSLLARHPVTIAHAHGRIPAVLLRLLQPRYHFRLVTTAHLDFPRRGWGRFSIWGEKTLAVSQDIKDHLIRVYRLSPDNIAVTVNGIDTVRFAPRSHEDGFQLVHVSRLDSDRSRTAFLLVSLMPALLQRFPDAMLTIIGEGDRLPALRAHAAAIDPHGRHIRLRGGLTDIRPDLETADLFIGVSRAALEAMACGIPTILSGDQGYLGLLTSQTLPEAVTTNLCCRGRPLPDQDSLLTAITACFTLPSAEKQALRAFGRQTVLAKYPFDRTAEDCLSLYASLPPRTSAKSGRILMIGYFGYGNTGDEAILDVEITAWRRQAPERPITVLSARPSETARRYGVTAIGRFSLWNVWKALRCCQTVVFGGGGLLQDSTSKRSLAYYALLLWLASRFKKEIHVTANGIGPITSSFGKKLTAAVLRPIPSLGVRDCASAACLQRLGYRGKIIPCADPAIHLPPADPERLQHLLRRHALTKGHYLVVAPKGGSSVSVEVLAAHIQSRIGEDHTNILLLPLFPREDEAICRRLRALLPHAVWITDLSPGEIRALIASAAEVIAMRWHALLFASESGVPFYTVAGDFKTESFLREKHREDCILLTTDPPYLTSS
ncbi:MAG: polysaccharide pyruvyl transferase CsaB [Ruminococcaceae bacterium]|nr:polysaccharide pyruvyl transferase CsaB [Oscillospiraceae bacterium]